MTAIHLRRVVLHPEQYPTSERYPFNLPIFRATPGVEFTTPVTLFVGENGTGKSTLLKAIARKCHVPIWVEEASARVERNPYEELLPRYLDVQWTDGEVPGSYFASQVFRQFTELLEDFAVSDPGQLKYFGGQSLITKSHGQSLMAFFKSRYVLKGLYLLDEPETALSPQTQLDFLRFLHAMAGAGHAQFIICTHSPILLSCPDATIYSFDQPPIAPVAYENTGHYRLYRDFMADPRGHVPE